ncbi:MAG: hypothetical protein GF365_04855 [Candidatus Buchananbacteria bacterium]|nr:hypothetical protein [Candidatus Buchananbacteria bacterium]
MTKKKLKGNLLEDITEQLCSGIKGSKVRKRVKIDGKFSGRKREIDILINGKCGVFDVQVAIESKNQSRPVDVDKVEAFSTKLKDIGADLGIMVCANGFTTTARKIAEKEGIQLYEVYDKKLGNTNLLIPVRYAVPIMNTFNAQVGHRSAGPFTIPQDVTQWRIYIDNKLMGIEQLANYAWNKGMIPQLAGKHIADFGAVTLSDVKDPKSVQYCELKLEIEVIEKYYLKIYPASFMKNLVSGKKNINLCIDAYCKELDMIKNGWKVYNTKEELDLAADIENQPEEVRNLFLRENYSIND